MRRLIAGLLMAATVATVAVYATVCSYAAGNCGIWSFLKWLEEL